MKRLIQPPALLNQLNLLLPALVVQNRRQRIPGHPRQRKDNQADGKHRQQPLQHPQNDEPLHNYLPSPASTPGAMRRE